MRITQALKILHAAEPTTNSFSLGLACGFTPLHLSTFLAAHLQQRLPDARVQVQPGLYGDLRGTLESLTQTSFHAIAVAVEWADLDPRLGFRSTAKPTPSLATDIVLEATQSLHRLSHALEALPSHVPAALSIPTLPLPPLFHTPGWQFSESEAALDSLLAAFALNLQRRTRIKLANPRRLGEDSPPAQRLDLKSDLLTGLPYTLTHADALASSLARLLLPTLPLKGIITDLDDTLWSGLIGEVGPENVAWDLASHKAFHGLYQRLLAALAQEGVLIAVASKNSAPVVAQAFQRADILLPSSAIFPMEVHWDPKSVSVSRILAAWNISADSVVFIDDSPIEIAEVASVHPGINSLQFPGRDNSSGGLNLLRQLRDMFGKAHLSNEDLFRIQSIRSAAVFANQASVAAEQPEAFLRQLNAVIAVEFPEGAPEPRTLELINKTNQFNLNGRRYTEAEWSIKVAEPNAVLAVVSYEDKFGLLGRIAVLQGVRHQRTLRLDVWVLSCRAFARRIEHRCLEVLFDHCGVDTIEFSFVPTPRNGPLAEFVKNMVPPNLVLTRQHFQQQCPPLYHTVTEGKGVTVFNG